jgi:hypothetical protein
MAKFRALLVTKDGDWQSIAVTELTDAYVMEGKHNSRPNVRYGSLASLSLTCTPDRPGMRKSYRKSIIDGSGTCRTREPISRS